MTARRNQPAPRTLRIIGGNWRSRKVSFPDHEDIRPTGDRVRETLFNWLMHDVHGATCVDLFAGSGILAIEALSRGAARVDIVDTDARTLKAIGENLQHLAADPGTWRLKQETAAAWIRSAREPVDIAFVDPPFGSDLLSETLGQLAAGQLVNHAVYVESGNRLDEIPLPAGWTLHRSKRAGHVNYGLVLIDGFPKVETSQGPSV